MIVTLNPVVVDLGPVVVRWFGLFALLGLSVAIWGSLRELEAQHLGRKVALDALAWGLPVGFITARLVHVMGAWDFYLTNASELGRLSIDGLSLWGGLVGGGLVAWARLRRDPRRRRRILDAIVPYAALGIALGRVGEFLDGTGQGLPSTLAWATRYTDPLAATPDFGVSRHPAQLYDGLVALGLCAVLLAIPRAAPAGTRTTVFVLAYGLARVALGGVRLDPAFLFGLQLEQLLALAAIGFGLILGVRTMLQVGRSGARRLGTGHTAEAIADAKQRKEGSLAA